VRVGEAAPVARTQVDRGQFIRRKFFQIVEGELGLSISAVAADRDLVGRSIDVGDVGEVIADEELVVRRDGGRRA
jgi:hypothetical protein